MILASHLASLKVLGSNRPPPAPGRPPLLRSQVSYKKTCTQNDSNYNNCDSRKRILATLPESMDDYG